LPVARAFEGAAAMQRLRWLMDHPRTLGGSDRAASIDALVGLLEDVGATVERVEHVERDPATDERFELVEVIGHLRPEAPRRFILASHFDTRPWADEEDDPAAHDQPVPGANDGSSGVAVVLELLPHLQAVLPEDVGVSVVLFDGEELGHPTSGGYCVGSQHLATRIRDGKHPRLSCASFGIVLDMVGDRDLHLPIESSSARYNPELTDRLWSAAEQLGHAVFERDGGHEVIDDHRYLSEAGVPSVLIIDHDYVAWHTRDDTLALVSQSSLEAVGQTVLLAVAEYWRDPPRSVRDSPPCR
jgi:hypothetical protein